MTGLDLERVRVLDRVRSGVCVEGGGGGDRLRGKVCRSGQGSTA